MTTSNESYSRNIQRAKTSLAVCTAAFTVAGVIDIALHPTLVGDHLHSAGDYALTAWIFPVVLSMLYLVTRLRALHPARGGRLMASAVWLLAAAVVLFCVDGVATLVTGDERRLGPVYPLATLASFIAVVLFAVALFRRRVVPRWAGPLLAMGWIVGGPVAALGVLFFVPAATCAVLATRFSAPDLVHPPAIT